MPEDDTNSPQNRQLPPKSVHPSHSVTSTQGFTNFDEHAAANRRPHWGNSYDVAPGPHNRVRGNEMDMTTDNLNSVLTRTNNYLGMQPNHRGNFQVHLVQKLLLLGDQCPFLVILVLLSCLVTLHFLTILFP